MLIKNGNVVLPDKIIESCNLHIDGDIISCIGEGYSTGEIIDAAGLYVCPGFVDIHTHGGFGGDFMDATDDAFNKALGFHCQNGTTTVLATSLTAPVESINDMISKVRSYKRNTCNSKIAGIHLEGPYLSYKNKGAQHESYLRIPCRDSYDFILENADIVKTVTIAPELEGADKMTKDLIKAGIKVCGGHDDGEKDTLMPAIRAGLSHLTHLWCAMSTVAMRDGVRSVGLVELGLINDSLTVEIIADNHHITPEMAMLIFKCKGADRMCLVSDSLRAGGMEPDGKLYSLGLITDETAHKFIVSDGVARLPDGSRYAGSIQPLRQMAANMYVDCGFKLCDVIKMVSLTPARIIGEDKNIGSVECGKKADLCILDKDFNLIYTIIDGKIEYSNMKGGK